MFVLGVLQRGFQQVAQAILGILPEPLRELQHDVRRAAVKQWRKGRVLVDVKHVTGPTNIELTPTDAVVVSLVQNGEEHVEHFLEHHFELGVCHAVLIDNGSTDGTIERARQFDRVTILQSTLPFKQYKHHLRRYGLEKFGGGGWCLITDIDERFDFPFSDRIDLSDLLHYLNQNNYSAVVAQMLDLFAEGSPSEWPEEGQEFAESCIWYDNTALISKEYEQWMPDDILTSNEDIKKLEGGVRRKLFGVEPTLTKHPLLFKDRGAKFSLDNLHACRDAHVADVSCVLYHYKFGRSFRKKCRVAVEQENYWAGSWEYQAYLQKLKRSPNLELKQSSAQKLRGVKQLVEEGFLVVSEAYNQFVRKKVQGKNGHEKTNGSFYLS